MTPAAGRDDSARASGIRPARALYRACLWLLPLRLRRQRTREMLELFDDLYRDARRRGRVVACRYTLRATLGALRAAAAARLDSTRTPRSRAGDPMLVRFVSDLRLAARTLRRTPGFTAIAILTLALGIGATTAIFSLVHGVVLKPLPYEDEDSLILIDHKAPEIGFEGDLGMAGGLYAHYNAHVRSVETLSYWEDYQVTITSADEDPERVWAVEPTSDLFTTLRVRPEHGRLFGPGDDLPEADRVVLLQHAYWQRRFGGDPAVVGQELQVSGRAHVIVGVLPESFRYPGAHIYLSSNRDYSQRFGGFNGESVARVRPGTTIESLRADLDAQLQQIEKTLPDPEITAFLAQTGVAAVPVPLKQAIVGPVRQTLWILMGSVAFVLLIACANVANLFLVRAERRQREVAVRHALGASRGQVLRSFLAESLVLALIGGALGVGLAKLGVDLLVTSIPFSVPRLDEVGIDPVVLSFALTLSLLSGVVFALLPGLRREQDLGVALRDGSRSATVSAARIRTRQALVVGQIALSLVLLAGAALMARSFERLVSVDPGFDPEGVLTFSVSLPASRYDDSGNEVAAFHDRLRRRLAALPGVEGVGAIRDLPLSGRSGGDMLIRESDPPAEGEIRPIVWLTRVTPDYFETMRMPVLSGRTIAQADQDDNRPVIVLNEAAVDVFFGTDDPLGERVTIGRVGESRWLEVIGVVGTGKQETLREEPTPMAFISTRGESFNSARLMGYAVRVQGEPLALADEVRAEVRALDPDLPLIRMRTADQIVQEAGAAMSFTLVLLGLASAMAVLLGSVGVYGVISYVVANRTAEIGIRMALGAAGHDVRRLLLRQGVVVGLAGVALGLGATLALARSLESLLYQVDPHDAASHSATAAVLFIVVLVATWLPALRASRIPPVEALRQE